MKFPTKAFILCLMSQQAFAQISMSEVVDAALRNHPLAASAAYEVQAKQFAEKAAARLPNPEVNIESPTGDFYTAGVSQSFEFPTVYKRQKQLARAETVLAQNGRAISENEIRLSVRTLYLETQMAEYREQFLRERDSLYQAMANTAARQFAAGEIDFLQKTLAEQEAGTIRQELRSAEQTAVMLRNQLTAFAGLAEITALLPLSADTIAMPASADPAANPSVAYEQQAAQVAIQQVRLEKSRALPNFSLGYFNQSARNAPLDYRFRATVGIPLWAGQYRAGIDAARAESQAALARAEAQSMAVALALERARTDMATTREKMRYYEREAVPRSRMLISTATRLRDAGETDYFDFLRTLAEAYAIRRDYAEQINTYETARIQVLYLTGR
ncbi:MAG: TolC family protein [Saprospiraceae bacterium]|nr:TolC family protein [Saprospiraceae bacterium]MCB0542166.1 TolC family protein [Saprospiraceae bacterium]MCB0574989.1 TolC family protein [Saprospiraceae bacterium]MCB9306881.1 TolC family protein [Lewinellaceae bacterium]MCB9356449.1 TolC family protein [Lewinellaceae bacterium]